MKRRSVITSIALLILLSVPFLNAAPDRSFGMQQPGLHRGPEAPDGFALFRHLRRIREELGLTDTQVDQIRAIMAETHDQNAVYREQLQGSYKEMTDILLANPNDIAAAQAVLDRRAELEHTIETNILNATSRALNILTADQRQKLAEIIAKRAARRAHRSRP